MSKKWSRHYICDKCGHEVTKKFGASDWIKCSECGERMWDVTKSKKYHIDVPTKQDARYYEEKWFRKSDKEWKKDIRSRRRKPDGSVKRVNQKGEVIYDAS